MGRPTRNTTIKHLNIQAWILGTNGADYCHVLRQASNTSFEVVSSTGVQGICNLSTAITQPAQMLVLAWDNLGGAYAVVHLTDNAVKLEPITGTVFPSGAIVAYSLIAATPDAVWLENDAAAPLTIPLLPTINNVSPHGNTFPIAVDNAGNVLYEYNSSNFYAWVFTNGSYTVLDSTGTDGIIFVGGSRMTSANGSVTVGTSYINNTNAYVPLVYNQSGAYTLLPTTGLSTEVVAFECSADGSRVVGLDVGVSPVVVVTWTNGVLDPTHPPIPGDVSNGVERVSITPDGETILLIPVETNDHQRILTLRNGVYTEIPPALDYTNGAWANNDLSVIISNPDLYITYNRGVTWQQLPGLGGSTNAYINAYALNDSLSIIGAGEIDVNGVLWPVYWQNGQINRLAPIPSNELDNNYQGYVGTMSRNGIYLLGDSYDQTQTDASVQWTRKV